MPVGLPGYLNTFFLGKRFRSYLWSVGGGSKPAKQNSTGRKQPIKGTRKKIFAPEDLTDYSLSGPEKRCRAKATSNRVRDGQEPIES